MSSYFWGFLTHGRIYKDVSEPFLKGFVEYLSFCLYFCSVCGMNGVNVHIFLWSQLHGYFWGIYGYVFWRYFSGGESPASLIKV